MSLHPFTIEIANRIEAGRAVGTDYVATMRAVGRSGIVFRARERGEVESWIASHRIAVTAVHRYPDGRLAHYAAKVGEIEILISSLRKVCWCSDPAALAVAVARGEHPLIREEHHGPDTYGHVDLVVDAAALADAPDEATCTTCRRTFAGRCGCAR